MIHLPHCLLHRLRWGRSLRTWLSWFSMTLLLLGVMALPGQTTPTSYDLAQAAPFNRPDFYPIRAEQGRVDSLYRPVADWTGRLILPDPSDISDPATDWVWIELTHTPPDAQDLLGQTVRLEWSDTPLMPDYPALVSRDIALGQKARTFARMGNLVPTRLDGRQQVGPLQSLAGARPNDDVEVMLQRVQRLANGDAPILQIDWEPVQITGRWYGLVQILGPDESRSDAPAPDCPQATCSSEYFRVRHYNPASGQLDGAETAVRIPQQPADRNSRFLSTPKDIEQSPAGAAGWYLYGAYSPQDIFTVQAIKPRSLVQLQPDRVILGERPGRVYTNRQNWGDMGDRKGTVQSVLVDPLDDTEDEAIARWQEGDSALLIHLFGGIGGENGEGATVWTVTGHYAYGTATVVREPIANELQFQIRYQQIYANNPNGIVSGSLDWTAYMGNLQRGWLGSRPVSDILVKYDALARPFQFGDQTFPVSILREMLVQTQILAARYRTGDGNGVAAVTPATSCVQDSSQALYIALEQLKQAVLRDRSLQQWLRDHPNDPEAERFLEVVELGDNLSTVLVPRGLVRPDWQQNAEFLAGVSGGGTLGNEPSMTNALLSWRSIMPRQAHDEISQILLKAGADLWFLRTNQVGGFDPTIAPVAPTKVLGQLPILSIPLNRFLTAFLTPLQTAEWGITLLALGLFTAIALPYGLHTGFLHYDLPPIPAWKRIALLLWVFFLPAVFEESIRILILPHPSEGILGWRWLAWALLALGLYVAYHPLNARFFYKKGDPTFFTPTFLWLCTLLGLTCTVVYAMTGSLQGITLIHWLVVASWILLLGGYKKLHLDRSRLTAGKNDNSG